MTANSLVLIGLNDAGKTMYGAQVLGRIWYRGTGALRAGGAPASYEPFYSAWRLLSSEGKTAPHTAREQYGEIAMNLLDRNGVPVSLSWPDYGGEQIRSFVDRHGITKAWQTRVRHASDWILMLRLSRIRQSDDIANRAGPVGSGSQHPPSASKQNSSFLSDQALLIEVLQILLYLRRTGGDEPTQASLTILLSCWDELASSTQQQRPIDAMRSRAPMLASFLEASWRGDDLVVYGLSALGKTLSQTNADADYAYAGPQFAGYIVDRDGLRSDDLTLPIASAIARQSHR